MRWRQAWRSQPWRWIRAWRLQLWRCGRDAGVIHQLTLMPIPSPHRICTAFFSNALNLQCNSINFFNIIFSKMLPGSEWGKGMIDVAVTKQRHGMGSPGVWQWQTTVEPYWTIFSITFSLMTHIELSRWGYYWLKLTGVSQIAKLVQVGWWQNDEWRVDVVSRHWDIEKHWVVNGLMLLEILCGMYNNRGKIFLNHRKKKTT